jgi:hypothetical protein
VASANGKNVPATLNGTSPTFFADPGYVRFLPANNNYLMVGDLKNFYPQVTSATRSGVFTLSLWFNPTGLNGVLASDLWSSSINTGYHTTDIEMVNGNLYFAVWPRSTYIYTATAVSLNTWHHVVLTYTGSKVIAYLDGALVGSATYTRVGPAMGSLTDSQYFGIGATDGTNFGSGAYGNFLLGNVKFYASSLSAADINQIYRDEKTKYDLSFLLDAGNASSYPGSGTNWFDISGAGKTATNGAGTTYNAAGGGSMYYNGTATGLTNFTFDVNSATTITIEMWVKWNASMNGMFLGFNTYDVWTYNGGLGYNSGNSDLYGISATQATNLGLLGNWRHYIFVMNSGSYLNNKIYINGLSQTMTQIAASQLASSVNFNSGLGTIGQWRASTSFPNQMYVSKFKIYNRELTQAEITAKFNKDKVRHGL